MGKKSKSSAKATGQGSSETLSSPVMKLADLSGTVLPSGEISLSFTSEDGGVNTFHLDLKDVGNVMAFLMELLQSETGVDEQRVRCLVDPIIVQGIAMGPGKDPAFVNIGIRVGAIGLQFY